MTQIEEVKKLFDRIKMLQKTFSLIREGRIKASDFPSRTSELMQAIKEDVKPAIKNMKYDCRNNVSGLEDYSNLLQECCTQTEYYIPTKVGMRVPLCPTVTDALIDACSLTSKEAAQDLFADYIFIIDQRNEIACRLESELARLQEEQEQLKTKQEQEADRLKQEKEQERKERQKEQAEMMKSIAEIKSIAEMMKKQKEEQKPKKAPSEEAGQQQEETKYTYTEKLLDLFYRHVDYIDKLIGLSDKEIAEKIHGWSKLQYKDRLPICNKVKGNKSAYAEALKENGLIKVSAEWFRQRIL